VLGYQIVGSRVVVLTRRRALVFEARAGENEQRGGDEDMGDATDGDEVPMRLPNGMLIPEHLLDDW
jgi:hypothetical protein